MTDSTPKASHEHMFDMKHSPDKDTNNATLQSWPMAVSHYLQQRQAQTQRAYTGQLQALDEANPAHATQDWLFNALLTILVQRLEEGHTVFVLAADNNEGRGQPAATDTSNNLNNDYEKSPSWQQQLLQPLVQPLLSYVAVTLNQEVTIAELFEANNALWHQAFTQTILPIYDRENLQQRYDTCLKLYHYILEMDKLIENKNSLSNLIKHLRENKLFNNSEAENSSPIIFEVERDLDDQSSRIVFWLHRTWQAEHALTTHIVNIMRQSVVELPLPMNSSLGAEQQEAINMANQSAFSIITGGPGTGKTFTVAQLVIAIQQSTSDFEHSTTEINMAIAAPTGKAAQRMQESLQEAIGQAGINIQLPEAKTIHRLLGIGQGGKPRYNQKNPLSEDIIIVDEASMLGVELANHLVSAVKTNARLILLGDANQLAAVDAGAVLADLCRIPSLRNVHRQLKSSRRFSNDSGIGRLAYLINQERKDMTEVWQLIGNDNTLNFSQLTQSQTSNIDNKRLNSLSGYKFYLRLCGSYSQYLFKALEVLQSNQVAKSVPIQQLENNFDILMGSFNQFRILTAGHNGKCGDHAINLYLSQKHKEYLKLPLTNSPWYHGRPVMILQNTYELGLFNGDIGICMQTQEGSLKVFFENKLDGIAIAMLSEEMVATAYAMTIHKSQGSEFEHVAICFDDSNARLLSQELIYTAVTRAKEQVSVFSTTTAFTQALNTPTVRQTGLSLQFAKF